MLLAIETSCDETAVALLDISRRLDDCERCEDFLRGHLVRTQIQLHEPYGGVVPELAAREHLANLPVMVEHLLHQTGVELADLTAIAVTAGPGLKGCLLVGIAYARGLAFARKLPFVPVNHLEGHVCSGDLGARAERPEYPLLAMLVSGGHSELILAKQPLEYTVLTRTRDDAVGEAFDKCATQLGLPYPGGPALSRLAAGGHAPLYRLPQGMADDDTAFSFSGVKTAVHRLVKSLGDQLHNEQTRADVAAAIEDTLVETLLEKTGRALKRSGVRSLLLCGGVAANGRLRRRAAELAAQRGIRLVVPDFQWCSDNAAMIGVAAARRLERAGGVAAWPPAGSEACVARTRWPLEQLSPAG